MGGNPSNPKNACSWHNKSTRNTVNTAKPIQYDGSGYPNLERRRKGHEVFPPCLKGRDNAWQSSLSNQKGKADSRPIATASDQPGQHMMRSMRSSRAFGSKQNVYWIPSSQPPST